MATIPVRLTAGETEDLSALLNRLFGDEAELNRLTHESFEIDLDALTEPSPHGLGIRVLDLISVCDDRGWVHDLLLGARRLQQDPELTTFKERFFARAPQRLWTVARRMRLTKQLMETYASTDLNTVFTKLTKESGAHLTGNVRPLAPADWNRLVNSAQRQNCLDELLATFKARVEPHPSLDDL